MRNRTEPFRLVVPGKAMMPRKSPAYSAALAALVLAVLPALAPSAHAQDAADERRCTGQSRATNDERVVACSALIDSGRYLPSNLAILHHDRGMAMRAKG